MIIGMTRLAVISTGGTIATSADAGGTLRPTCTAADLLGAAGGADLAVAGRRGGRQGHTGQGGQGRVFEQPHEFGGCIPGNITHGTDTLEETALWLELTYAGAPPVILTGATRGADDPAADGPANLRDALALAARPETRNQGVLVSFGGRVLTPWGLRKTGAATCFAGEEWDGRPRNRRWLAGVSAAGAPRVDIVAVYPGSDGVALDACVAAGARAIVLEALGAGNAGRAVVDAVARLCRDGVTVAIASRVCGAAVYPGYGPGRAMVDAGAVAVSGLGPPQARVLLMAALAADLPVAQTVARFS